MTSYFTLLFGGILFLLCGYCDSKLTGRSFWNRQPVVYCPDGKQVHPAQVCDGVLNCVDGADENNFTLCATRPRACTREEFTCANRKCVPLARLCNREDDCGDRSDEIGCNAVGSCEDGECAHACTNDIGVRGAYLCYCAPGFKVGKDHRSCEDIDECASFHVHRCPQLCENTIGSFSCRCKPGYVWSQYRCWATGPSAVLVYAVGSRLLQLVKDSFYFFIRGPSIILTVDFDPIEKIVYWADVNSVLRRSLVPRVSDKAPDFGRPQALLESELTIAGIALDWVSRNVYVAEDARGKNLKDHKHGFISVSTIDGRYKKILLFDNVQSPHAISVGPEVGMMVWTDLGCSPRVEFSWMDGSHRRVLVHTDISLPTGITLDRHMGHRVFWCDSALNRIESINLDGSDRALVASGENLEHPLKIDVFGLTLYWSTRNSHKLLRQDKFGRGAHVTVTTHTSPLMDFKVYQPLKQTNSLPNPCATKRCSHLCLINPIGAICACPEGTAFKRFTRRVCDAVVEGEPPHLPRCDCTPDQVCKVDPVSLDLTCD